MWLLENSFLHKGNKIFLHSQEDCFARTVTLWYPKYAPLYPSTLLVFHSKIDEQDLGTRWKILMGLQTEALSPFS